MVVFCVLLLKLPTWEPASFRVSSSADSGMDGWADACLFYPDYQITSNRDAVSSLPAVVLNLVGHEV